MKKIDEWGRRREPRDDSMCEITFQISSLSFKTLNFKNQIDEIGLMTRLSDAYMTDKTSRKRDKGLKELRPCSWQFVVQGAFGSSMAAGGGSRSQDVSLRPRAKRRNSDCSRCFETNVS